MVTKVQINERFWTALEMVYSERMGLNRLPTPSPSLKGLLLYTFIASNQAGAIIYTFV